jgi:hypothetical protein
MTPLDRLATEAFDLEVGPLLPTVALHARLANMQEVQELQVELAQGSLGDEDIATFVSGLTSSFRPGERFDRELTLAALAVALERRGTEFAKEYLDLLACLPLREVRTAARIAAECRRRRAFEIAGIEIRSTVFNPGQEPRIGIPRVTSVQAGETGRRLLSTPSNQPHIEQVLADAA